MFTLFMTPSIPNLDVLFLLSMFTICDYHSCNIFCLAMAYLSIVNIKFNKTSAACNVYPIELCFARVVEGGS
jgi:hypothetical protein